MADGWVETWRQLQSIIGQLSNAAIVVQPERTFLRSLIETANILKKQEHLVHLNGECKTDLYWWHNFLEGWNGVALFPGRPVSDTVTSYASGSWVLVPSWKGDHLVPVSVAFRLGRSEHCH